VFVRYQDIVCDVKERDKMCLSCLQDASSTCR